MLMNGQLVTLFHSRGETCFEHQHMPAATRTLDSFLLSTD